MGWIGFPDPGSAGPHHFVEDDRRHSEVEPPPERIDDGADDPGDQEDQDNSGEESTEAHASADRPPENENDGSAKHGVADDFQPVSDRLGVGECDTRLLGGQSAAGARSQGESDRDKRDQEKHSDYPPASFGQRRSPGVRRISMKMGHSLDLIELVISGNEEARRGTGPGGLFEVGDVRQRSLRHFLMTPGAGGLHGSRGAPFFRDWKMGRGLPRRTLRGLPIPLW